MEKESRKILFYQLLMYMNDSNKEKLVDLSEFELMFNKLIAEKMQEIDSTNKKAMFVELKDGNYVIEIIKQNMEEHIYYIKLGVHNPTNSIEIRDKNTLKTDGIKIGESQSLEIYTLCVIDFVLGVISYVKMNGSARVSIIKDILNMCYMKQGYEARLAVICEPDVIAALSKKKRIMKLNMDLAVPSDAVLANIGLSEPTFDDIRGTKSKTISFELKADRGKTLFDEPSKIRAIISRVLTSVNQEKIKKISATTKDEMGNYSTINLLLEGVTMMEYTEKNTYDKVSDFERLDMIYSKYKENKNEIASYIR